MTLRPSSFVLLTGCGLSMHLLTGISGCEKTYYGDADSDTYGNPDDVVVTSGTQPPGYVEYLDGNATDCNDTNAAVHPFAVEVAANGIDNNCNGRVDEAMPVMAGGGIEGLGALTLVADGFGNVWAAGSNRSGQLGNGTTTDSSTPVQVKDLSGIGIVSVAVHGGYQGSLALDDMGQVWAWGDNAWSGTTTNSLTPVPVAGLSGIVAIADCLALDGQGRVFMCAEGSGPVQVGGLSGIVAIAVGSGHSLALDSSGWVWAWGNNDTGQLGNGTTGGYSLTPAPVNNISGIVAIAAGGQESLALDGQGHVWAWGRNPGGGDGSFYSSTPVQVVGLNGIVAVAAGYYHSLALDGQGRVWAWGGNSAGQFGNGTTTSSFYAVNTGVSGMVTVAAGDLYSLSLDAPRQGWAWGNNAYGQLGNGTKNSSSTPVKMISIPLAGQPVQERELGDGFGIYR